MRHIIQTATAILLLTANMQGLYAKTFLPPEEVKTIKVGDTKVTWLQDNGSKQRAAIFPGVPQSLLDSLGVADGIPSSMSAFLVEREGKQILFDTGLGKVGSRLLPLLESLGIKPEDIKYRNVGRGQGRISQCRSLCLKKRIRSMDEHASRKEQTGRKNNEGIQRTFAPF